MANRVSEFVRRQHALLNASAAKLGAAQRRIVAGAVAKIAAKVRGAEAFVWNELAQLSTLAMITSEIVAAGRAQVTGLAAGTRSVVHGTVPEAARWLRENDARAGLPRALVFDDMKWTSAQGKTWSATRLRHFERSVQLYGAEAVAAIERSLAQSITAGAPWSQVRSVVIEQVRDVVAGADWKIDRIVRTEVSAAYNGTILAALDAEDTARDPMFKRLQATFDKATGKDSMAVHGQLRRVGEPFFDPFHGREYMAPPNRPNDREIIVGWRASYGKMPRTGPRRIANPQPPRTVAAAAEREAADLRAQIAARRRMGKGLPPALAQSHFAAIAVAERRLVALAPR